MGNKHAFIRMKKMFGNDMGKCEDILIFFEIDNCLFSSLLNSYFSIVENLSLPVFQNISDEKRHKMSIILSKSLRLEKGLNNNTMAKKMQHCTIMCNTESSNFFFQLFCMEFFFFFDRPQKKFVSSQVVYFQIKISTFSTHSIATIT
jgi:hypothetical protein